MPETIFEEVRLNELETEIKMGKLKANIHLGDCLDVLKKIESNTVDLIVTSPPYADSRTKTYGGIKPSKYVDWFLPRSREFLRVLKPAGTFILNIKERVVGGERHTYVLDLILRLREQGWLWTEEFIWHKRNCHPGKWPNRFRDAWERLLQFNKSRHFAMYQDAVMVPMGEWAKTRLKHLGKNDVVRFDSQVKSGFGKNISNWIGRQMAYPSNVLYMATETGNKQHSAVFPRALPEWFIKLFTKENDLILDPFLGSGTVIEVAYRMKRNSIGIESAKKYYLLAKERLTAAMEDRSYKRNMEKDMGKRNGEKELFELATSSHSKNIVAVNGCCYGKESNPDKGDYFKHCGQEFWALISGSENFYTEIIEPLGYKAKEKNDNFTDAYAKVINKFTKEFMKTFCVDGKIDWKRVVRFNSGR